MDSAFYRRQAETEEVRQLKEKNARLEEEKDMALKELGKKQLEIELLKKNEDFWDRSGK